MLHNEPYVSTCSMIFIFCLLYSGKKIETLRPCSASRNSFSFYLLFNKFKYNLVLRKSQLHVKGLLISRYVLLKQTFLTTLVKCLIKRIQKSITSYTMSSFAKVPNVLHFTVSKVKIKY